VDDVAQLMHTLDAMEAVAMTQEEQTQVKERSVVSLD